MSDNHIICKNIISRVILLSGIIFLSVSLSTAQLAPFRKYTAADGLIFSWRETKGTGEWNNFMLYGPEGTGGLTWPRMVTTG